MLFSYWSTFKAQEKQAFLLYFKQSTYSKKVKNLFQISFSVVTDFESAGIALTVVYFLSTLPVWIFQHKIQYWDIRSMCTLEWLCPNFVLSNLPIRRSASQITHHQTNIPRSRNRYIVTAHYCFLFHRQITQIL